MTGHVLAMPLQNNLGYIGLFITREEFRGQGYGRKVMMAALKALDGKNVLLNAVAGTQDMYAKFGFHQSKMTCKFILGHVSSIPNDMSFYDVVVDLVTEENVCAIRDYDRAVSTIDRWDHQPQWLLSRTSKCSPNAIVNQFLARPFIRIGMHISVLLGLGIIPCVISGQF